MVPREFRAAWIATVANIDWPSAAGLPTAQQQTEMVDLLDTVAGLNMNAVIFQVRPAGDAFYPDEEEPWSGYLTGMQGTPPAPYYDPLQFTIDAAHARCIQVHGWFNPFRVEHPANPSRAASHIVKRHPEWVREYGDYLWLDPGIPEVHDYVIDLMVAAIERYDLDGVHLDDYFYPYKVSDGDDGTLDFPDDASYAAYVEAGGTLARDDWRRDNINRFVEQLYIRIKTARPEVLVGISPFGIWRPGHPPQIQGFDPYAELYADSKRWLVEGWLDYFTPQLYWAIEPPAQSYPVLLEWWTNQNPHGRHIWPGQFTSRIGGRQNWTAEEIVNQIEITRAQAGADGTVHFSIKPILQNRGRIADALADTYAEPALVPASTWLDSKPPPMPLVNYGPEAARDLALEIDPLDGEPAAQLVVQTRYGKTWETRIVPGDTALVMIPAQQASGRANLIAVSAVDRLGNQSKPAILR